MKLKPVQRQTGYTLTEMLVSMGIFGLVLVAILACYLAGLQFSQFIQPKIQNAQSARQMLGSFTDEIRSANSVQVGTGTLTNFTPVASTNLQAGNALRIYPSTNTTQYIYYFHDAASASVQKIGISAANAIAVATDVTNNTIFSLQDFGGNVLTNSQNSSVTVLLLQMVRNSSLKGFTDTYQVSAKITRRNIL